MPSLRRWYVALTILPLVCLACPQAHAEKMPVKPTVEISGSVDDAAALKDAPKVLASTADLEKLWKALGREDKPPKVDFAKELVVHTTSVGSRLKIIVTLDENGNLDVGGLGTKDLRPGLRYVLAVVPREGVKTVGGKELPKP